MTHDTTAVIDDLRSAMARVFKPALEHLISICNSLVRLAKPIFGSPQFHRALALRRSRNRRRAARQLRAASPAYQRRQRKENRHD